MGYDQHRAQQIEKLYQLAKDRGETLSQLAIQWLWQQKGVTSVLVGVHSKAQLLENLAALEQPPLSEADLIRIDSYSNNSTLYRISKNKRNAADSRVPFRLTVPAEYATLLPRTAGGSP